MKKLYIVLLCIIVVCFSVVPTSSGVAFATGESSGSKVLDDLSVDKSFSAKNYPVDNTDYRIYVFQIAESTDKELLIYTYQPCVEKDFRATSISMSLTINDSIKPQLYQLEYLNSSESLYKYKVKDFTVSDSVVRFYEIYEIFRVFDSTIDQAYNNDNTVEEIYTSVGKQWKFFEVNGNPCVECRDVDVIDITDFYVGFCRYSNGYSLLSFPSSTDAHIIAFRTERRIDTLCSADVTFITKTCSERDGDITYGDPTNHLVTVNKSDVVTSDSDRWNAHRYQWNRIRSVEQFITEENQNCTVLYNGLFVKLSLNNELTENATAALRDMQWVLNFYETPYVDQSNVAAGVYRVESIRVSEVAILRLEFITDGITYNLGIISNKQTGSTTPINTEKLEVELTDDFWGFLKILLIIVGVLILCVSLPYVIKFLGFVLKIIIAPFKWIFGSSKRRDRDRRR